jgi:hypothetical protein
MEPEDRIGHTDSRQAAPEGEGDPRPRRPINSQSKVGPPCLVGAATPPGPESRRTWTGHWESVTPVHLHRRARTALTVAVAFTVLLVLLAPGFGGAVAAGAVTGPPYGGVVAPSSVSSTAVCGKVSLSTPWTFHLKTGTGGSISRGQATGCGRTMAALGLTDMAQLNGGVLVSIPVKSISNATTGVNASLSVSFAIALSASDGFGVGAHAPCAAPQSTFYQATMEFDWGYNSSSGRFANQNLTLIQKTNAYTTTSVSGSAPPSPFRHNSTSAFYQAKRFGAYRSCDAEAGGYLTVQASLLDKTTGASFSATGDTVAVAPFGSNLDALVQVDNTTDWACSEYSEWVGPSNYSASQPLTCSSYNRTTYSYFFSYPGSSYSVTSTNNSQPWGATRATTGEFWWNSSSVPAIFATGHTYALELVVDSQFFATNSWPAGSAHWSFNMAVGGYALKLLQIGVT